MPPFGQCLVHIDSSTDPWMPRVTNLAKLSTMGVALPTCTIAGVRIRASDPAFRTRPRAGAVRRSHSGRPPRRRRADSRRSSSRIPARLSSCVSMLDGRRDYFAHHSTSGFHVSAQGFANPTLASDAAANVPSRNDLAAARYSAVASIRGPGKAASRIPWCTR